MTDPTRFPNGVNDSLPTEPLAMLGRLDPNTYAEFFEDFTETDFGDYPADSDGVALKYAVTLDVELDIDVSFGGATGALILTTEGGDNEGGQFRLNATPFQLTSGKKAWFDCRFKIGAGAGTIGQESFFIGLSDNVTSTNFIAADGLSLAVDEAWGFVSYDAEAGVDFVVRDNDVAAGSTDVDTIADDTFMRLSLYYNGTDTLVYADGVHVATQTATHPTGDPMTMMVHFRAEEVAVKTLTLDYVYVAIER